MNHNQEIQEFPEGGNMGYEIECHYDNCKKYMNRDAYTYCEVCFRKLKEKVSDLEKENGRLKTELEELRKENEVNEEAE